VDFFKSFFEQIVSKAVFDKKSLKKMEQPA